MGRVETELIGDFLLHLYHQRVIKLGARYFSPVEKIVVAQYFFKFLTTDLLNRLGATYSFLPGFLDVSFV